MSFSDDELHVDELNKELKNIKHDTYNEFKCKLCNKKILIKKESNKSLSSKLCKNCLNELIKENKIKIETPYAIDYIPFKEFMKIHNFRDSYKSSDHNFDNDTKIIRIYYGDLNGNYSPDKWFEFGVYDFGTSFSLVESLNLIFSEKILNSYVYSFCVNNETSTLDVFLTGEPGDEYGD